MSYDCPIIRYHLIHPPTKHKHTLLVYVYDTRYPRYRIHDAPYLPIPYLTNSPFAGLVPTVYITKIRLG